MSRLARRSLKSAAGKLDHGAHGAQDTPVHRTRGTPVCRAHGAWTAVSRAGFDVRVCMCECASMRACMCLYTCVCTALSRAF